MNPARVLVIRLSSLGDVLLTTPVLAALKTAWPGARLTVLTKGAFAPVFQGNPYAEDVAVFEDRGLWGWAREIRRRKYDVLIDLHDTPRSRVWTFLSNAPCRVRYDKRAGARRTLVWFKRESPRLAGGIVDRYQEPLVPLGVIPADGIPKLYIRAEEKLSADWERRLGPGPFLALAPGALHATKRWFPDRFAEAADRLAGERGWPVVLLGAAADQDAAEGVLRSLHGPAQSLVGQTSLREMMLVLNRSALLLTNDSGAMHVGAALGVPTVAVFGPTVKPFGFFPTAPWASVVETPGLACRPCSVHGSRRCPLGHFLCMGDVTADRVVAAGQALLKTFPKDRVS
ncbi:MAG: glycosyltransferase family 9 protein [Elusimicrobia bacterium]|nr:glycosyltransferase family 9 protein [Elusimicrobiota bacterium]